MKQLLLLILLFTAVTVTGQGRTFVVYQLNGSAWDAGGKVRKPLKIGQLLKDDVSLWLDKGAAVTLICENYSLMRITKSGGYVLAKHPDSCKANNYSLTTNYLRFIWDGFTHPHGEPEKNRRKYMGNAGAVTRGCPGIEFNYPVDTINNSTGNMLIRWQTNQPGAKARFVGYSDAKEGEELFSIPVVSNNSISLDTIKKYAAGREILYWNISFDEGEVCERNIIRFWSKPSYDKYFDSLVNDQVRITDKAEAAYIKGFYLESQHFFVEAYAFYKEAARLKPHEKRYQATLNYFKKMFKKS